MCEAGKAPWQSEFCFSPLYIHRLPPPQKISVVQGQPGQKWIEKTYVQEEIPLREETQKIMGFIGQDIWQIQTFAIFPCLQKQARDWTEMLMVKECKGNSSILSVTGMSLEAMARFMTTVTKPMQMEF